MKLADQFPEYIYILFVREDGATTDRTWSKIGTLKEMQSARRTWDGNKFTTRIVRYKGVKVLP